MARGFGSTFGAGTTDVVETAYTTLTTGLRSYGFWLNLNGLGGGSLGRVFDPATSTAGIDTLFISTEWNYQRAFAGGTVTFQWPSASTPNGTWNHVLIVYDAGKASNVPTVYVNGVSQTITVAGSGSGAAVTTSNNYYLGNRQSSGNRNFDGMLAHFCIWDNILLGADSALALAAGVNPLMISPETIVCYTPLDGVNKPEFDFGGKPTVAITGTRLGTSEPPAEQYLYDDLLLKDFSFSQKITILSSYFYRMLAGSGSGMNV